MDFEDEEVIESGSIDINNWRHIAPETLRPAFPEENVASYPQLRVLPGLRGTKVNLSLLTMKMYELLQHPNSKLFEEDGM